MTNMPIPYDTPELVLMVSGWLNAEPVKVVSELGAVRWTWAPINRAFMDSRVEKLWQAHEASIKHQPAWYRGRKCVGCTWPRDDSFIFSVIVRDSEQDFWCLPDHAARKHHAFKRLFCGTCNWAHDHCKCQKVA